MFIIKIQLNRQLSMGGFYFFYLLFLLHIFTAFFTLINALNIDLPDNEEIIQLSMDSIHVVKSLNSKIANTEVYTNDNDEKELVMALLTSYDDELKPHKEADNIIPIIVNTSTSIRFIPHLLHFTEQSIAVPRMQTVLIINDNSEPLELYSLSGTTNQFYSSFFKQTILPPHGGNTSINVYYLPRTIGITESIFTIKTNRGNFYYDVSGIGKLNSFRLRPLVNSIIPLNSIFEYTLQFHNPYNHSLDINEIYTSDENLIIELLPNKNIKNKITNIMEQHQQWHLKPYETKSIIKINYFAYKLNQLNGFICIKTNFSDIIIIPVEINVLDRPGLYSNVDLLEFTTDRFICSINKPITIPVYVFNSGLDTLRITDVRVTQGNKDYITVDYKNLQILPDVHRLNQIADITLHPDLIPDNIQHIHGYIQVYTSLNNDKPVLEIPFDETILHGSLEYKKEDSNFYISSLNNEKTDLCQPIRVFNRFNTSISVYDIRLNKLELLSQYVKIKHFSSFFYLYPNQWNELLCVTLLKQPLSIESFTNIQAVINVHTNLSYFNFPIHLYNAFLSLDLSTDYTNGGIRHNDANPFELSITSIPVNTSRTVTFMLTNPNPIDITIDKFYFTLSNIDIQIDYMKALNGNETQIMFKNNNISQLVIPEQHQAIFSLTIHGTSPIGFYNEAITFETHYQTLNINLKYQIINGSVEFMNKTPMHIDVFPNRVETVDIFVHNKFDESINVTRIDFISYGICFSFAWSNTSIGRVELQPNKIQQVGKLSFDMTPLCQNIYASSESTYYCDLNHHPEFKQRWDEYVSAINANDLDHTLVTKLRNLWKEWTSILKNQRIQTNIWLYTDRANISWPITIGFVQPSVLENKSSLITHTPMILDFKVTFINTTKTQNITIKNPSSDLLTYSVRLLNNHSKNSKSAVGDQIFTILTTSKEVEIINDIYNFNLLPNEHITFTISFRPISLIKYEMYIIVQNNLTIIESILLRGQGGIGSLQVGHRKAGSSRIPLVLEIDEKYYQLCLKTTGNSILRKVVTLHNAGNMKTTIHDISFGDSKCSGQGFSAEVCTNIEIECNQKYDLKILFQPDYTSNEINETLILNTDIGLMTFPIIVRIPQRVLSACYKTIPRPPWEIRSYYLCLCSLLVIGTLIFGTAVYDSRRLFDNYLARAEWRNHVQTTDNKIFDLKDLSLAVNEETTHEQIGSNLTTDTKKEKIIETSKNDNKHKRSITSMNTNGETSSKSTRLSDSSNTSVRSVAASPKATSNKIRRATTDGGSSKSPKHLPETSPKIQSVHRKSEHNVSLPSSRPPLSSNKSDDDNEPFVPARSRRTSNKTKESSTNIISKSTIENNLPLTRKSSVPIDQTDQQDLLKFDDSTDDQQWHMVISSKGQRKGNTPKREPTDESQSPNKTDKAVSTNFENSMVPLPSSHTHSSVSHDSPHSRRHERRRIINRSSLTSLPVLANTQSSQDNALLIVNNREQTLSQLNEPLQATELPSTTTASSMSIHSGCSSTSPSRRNGDEDETTNTNWNDNNEEENIAWDDPDTPDEDFGRYVSQTEYSMDESNDLNEQTHIQQKITTNHIPPLMSLITTPPSPPPPPPSTTSTAKTLPASGIKENIEPLPSLQHGPGPIQRPNKLPCSPTKQFSSFLSDTPQSPSTPDVLVQINHLLDHQNSVTTIPSTPNISNSTIINDLPTPNIPWTPFSATEWPPKYETSWSLANIPNSNISLSTQMQNPFVQRQVSREESNVWITPQTASSSSRTQRASEWNEIFSSTVPSSNETNNPFWNSINLNETQQNTSTPWWSKPSSDENNTNNNNNDQSRWDFAR